MDDLLVPIIVGALILILVVAILTPRHRPPTIEELVKPEVEVFEQGLDKTWQAANSSLSVAGCSILTATKEQGEILFEKPLTKEEVNAFTRSYVPTARLKEAKAKGTVLVQAVSETSTRVSIKVTEILVQLKPRAPSIFDFFDFFSFLLTVIFNPEAYTKMEEVKHFSNGKLEKALMEIVEEQLSPVSSRIREGPPVALVYRFAI